MRKSVVELIEGQDLAYQPRSPLVCIADDKKDLETQNQSRVVTYVRQFQDSYEGRSPHFISILHGLHAMTVAGIYDCGGTFRNATADVQIKGSAHRPPPASEIEAHLNDMLSRAGGWDRDWTGRQRVTMAASNFHEFLNIHPYRGGNGRVARAHLHLSLYEMEVIQPPLTLFDDMFYRRNQYIDALQAGDAGDLVPMCRFIERGVKDANIGAVCDHLLVQDEVPIARDFLSALTTKENKFVRDARVRRRLSDQEFERTVKKFTNRLLRLVSRALKA